MNPNEAEDYARRCTRLSYRRLSDALVAQLIMAGSPELLESLEQADDEQIERLNRLDRKLREAGTR